MNKRLRDIDIISREIRREWANPNSAALPYLEAMGCLEDKHSLYLMEKSSEIINRFLINATGFRGEAARRLKKELKEHLN